MKNLKVSMKLFVGFGVTVVLLFIVGITAIFNLKHLNSDFSRTIDNHGVPLADAGRVLEAIHSLRAETRSCALFTGNHERIRATRTEIDKWCTKFETSFETFGKFAIRPDTKKLMDESRDLWTKTLKPAAYKLVEDADKGVPQADILAQITNITKPAADKIAENMDKCMTIKIEVLRAEQADGNADYKSVFTLMVALLTVGAAAAILLGLYISSLISKPLAATSRMLTELGKGHLNERLGLHRADEIGAMARTMDTFADNLQNIVVGTMKKISDGDLSTKIHVVDPSDEIGAALKGTIDALTSLIIEDGGKVLLAAANKDMSQRMTHTYRGDYAKMKANINTVVENLDNALSQVAEAVGQVTSASNEISKGAQNLAEGANEQASSLEEVSSSLEEMSSMTKQNADNSNQAKLLASEARTAADEGDASMKRMATAINEIKQSADNTAKIIKTIDDIAFQTNLLALNAAVEAARAGEAGKGFAVVAEEVRNLAMRSAEAAKNTANMIEESVKSAEGGVKITEEVAKSLSQIVDRAGKVGDLIAEIAAASVEQASGIEQVNTAVASMNQVTQSNAANSEESASASEELSSQASELANMVSAFKLSGDGNRNAGLGNARRNLPPPQIKRPVVAALPNKSGASKQGSKPAKAVRAEDIIPLDDDELSEF